jgi:hypothetical protein
LRRWLSGIGVQVKQAVLFLKKKNQKDFCAWRWALSSPTLMTQHDKSFCGAFFKKRPLP